MDVDPKGCHHQLSRPPSVVTVVEGISYLVFGCLLCGCEITLRLNAEGQIDAEFIVPSAAKSA
jgi:hypothetical protein